MEHEQFSDLQKQMKGQSKNYYNPPGNGENAGDEENDYSINTK